MSFDNYEFRVTANDCDTKDDEKDEKFVLFMIALALTSIVVLSCTAIVD